MFEIVGTLHSYAQQFQLKKSAKQKIKTGESFDWKDAKTTFVKAQEEARAAAPKTIVEMSLEKSKQKDDDQTVKARTGSIKQKLKRGKKLSTDELEYLRQHDTELYKKAKITMEEREKLERALKSAKTKAEAMRAVAIASANAVAAYGDFGKSGGGGGGASGEAAAAGDAGASAEGAASFDTEVSVNVDASVGADAGAANVEAGGAADMSAGADAAASAESATNAEASATGDANAVEAENADGAEEAKETDAAAEDEKAGNAENAENTSSALDSLKDSGGEFDEPLILWVLRHLQAEWQDFMHTKQYKDLPEDELQAAKRHDAPKIRQRSEAVKAVSLTAVATAYQTAKTDAEVSQVLGTVGAAE